MLAIISLRIRHDSPVPVPVGFHWWKSDQMLTGLPSALLEVKFLL